VRSSFLLACLAVALVGCATTENVETVSTPIPEPAMTPVVPFGSFAGMKAALQEAANLEDAGARSKALDDFFAILKKGGHLPYASNDSVAFLYRGPAEHVSFAGDFNGWDGESVGAQRVGLSDVWIHEDYFPVDSRLDYKIVTDGIWGLDPNNPHIQRSGFGDNSELRMPGYVESPWVKRRSRVAHGALTEGRLFSENLRFFLDYLVYTPAGYEDLDGLPVMYVTDGHEYSDDRLGAMVAVMDNLVHEGNLRPMMAVFIDMRVNGANKRGDLLILNEKFVAFVAEELAPVIDEQYRTSTDRLDRGMLGTSLGGLNSMWFGLSAHETFGRIGVQSPAFHAGDGRIVGMLEDSPKLDIDIYLTYGTFNDFGEHTERVLKILDAKGYDYGLKIVNEGHSWGNWSALLDDILMRFWPAE
jgi:enterochelin esterase family protein